MSIMNYISFPRDVTEHQPNATYIKFNEEDNFITNPNAKDDWRKLLPIVEGQYEGRINFGNIRSAKFNNCFKNHFVHALHIEVPNYYHEQTNEISLRYYKTYKVKGNWSDTKDKDQELCVYWSKIWSLQNQVLHKYLQDNLNPGEFAELYTSWIEEEDENGMYFFPPTSEISISLNELPTLPYPKDWIDFGEREKITIHKME